MRRINVIILLVIAAWGCRTKAPKVIPQNPVQCLNELKNALRKQDLQRTFELLDRSTRFSIISVLKVQKKKCTLIKDHYPQAKKKRELPRCQTMMRFKTPEGFLWASAKRDDFFQAVLKTTKTKEHKINAERIELEGAEGEKLSFCKEGKGWNYCGLREHFEELKIKTTRDLTTVEENVEMYRRGR